ncbi:uncharacterized protein LOC127866422 [Dreissena polymorpha]|uniref:Uncharacterized protein n=1 Tax=Dreissena polymorpha TaxID=45954 RepID=A0A9D4RC47_DREPO|nr:uncharacterized protein LOC127866422 [Dreissena polymorpha]KAH3862981.1 hypothetical protein DPMN_025957 [Dreissena polymorpha]
MAFASSFGNTRASRSCHNDQNLQRHHFPEEETCGCVPGANKRRRKELSWQLFKERIRQFSIWYSETEEQRENERFNLRKTRKLNKVSNSPTTSLKLLRLLYGVDFAIAATGGAFLFCSTVKSIGGDTALFQNKALYVPLGVSLIALSVMLLLLATGIKHKMRKAHKPRRNFYILEKNKSSKSMLETHTFVEIPKLENADESDMTEMICINSRNNDNTTATEGACAMPLRVSFNTFDAPIYTDELINRHEQLKLLRLQALEHRERVGQEERLSGSIALHS